MWVCRGTRVGTVGFYKKEGAWESSISKEELRVKSIALPIRLSVLIVQDCRGYESAGQVMSVDQARRSHLPTIGLQRDFLNTSAADII